MKYKWTIRLALLTPVLLFLAAMAAGGGHGTILGCIIFFPFSTMPMLWMHGMSKTIFYIGMIQWPVYGYIIDQSAVKGKQGLTTLIILLVHIILTACIITFRPDGFMR